jgi:hypothetical protein
MSPETASIHTPPPYLIVPSALSDGLFLPPTQGMPLVIWVPKSWGWNRQVAYVEQIREKNLGGKVA